MKNEKQGKTKSMQIATFMHFAMKRAREVIAMVERYVGGCQGDVEEGGRQGEVFFLHMNIPMGSPGSSH